MDNLYQLQKEQAVAPDRCYAPRKYVTELRH